MQGCVVKRSRKVPCKLAGFEDQKPFRSLGWGGAGHFQKASGRVKLGCGAEGLYSPSEENETGTVCAWERTN